MQGEGVKAVIDFQFQLNCRFQFNRADLVAFLTLLLGQIHF